METESLTLEVVEVIEREQIPYMLVGSFSSKLRWLAGLRRNKDFDDSLQVATMRRAMLDWQYMEHWCDQHGTREILEEIRAKAFSA
jgi:hypothetical protein